MDYLVSIRLLCGSIADRDIPRRFHYAVVAGRSVMAYNPIYNIGIALVSILNLRT